MVRQFVAEHFEGMLFHHVLGDAGGEGLRLVDSFFGFLFHRGDPFFKEKINPIRTRARRWRVAGVGCRGTASISISGQAGAFNHPFEAVEEL